MSVLTIGTRKDNSWPLFKLVDKRSQYIEEIAIGDDEVQIRFKLKKKFGSYKLANWLFFKEAKRKL